MTKKELFAIVKLQKYAKEMKNSKPSKGSKKGAKIVIEELKLVAKCPLCEASYNPLSAKLLDQRDGAYLLHLRCQKCETAVVATVVTGAVGISSLCLVTDLMSEDVKKFQDASPIQLDEVLDIHESLAGIGKNFVENIMKDRYI